MEKNILIIEDDKDIREGVKILLEGEGYSVEEASNGADGLKKLTSHTNLVILDIMMPGISGNQKNFLCSDSFFNCQIKRIRQINWIYGRSR